MATNKEIEYSEAMANARHIVDYRAKIFHLMVILNATLLVVVLNHLDTLVSQLFISALALSTTFVFSLIDKRVTAIFESYLESIARLERLLEFSTMENAMIKIQGGASVKIQTYFQLLYYIFSVIWVAQIVYLIATCT